MAVPLAPVVIPAAIQAGGSLISSIFGTKSNNRAASQAANQQIQAGNYAADLNAKAAAEALAFAREQEAARQREWQQTQEQNYGIFREQNAYDRWLAEANLGLSRDSLSQSRYLTEKQLQQAAEQFAASLGLDREKFGYTKELEAARQNRLKPYQALGAGSLGQLAAPMARGNSGLAALVK